MGELLLVQLVDVVHGQCIGGMAVHHHPVRGVNTEPCHVAHEMGGEFGGKLAAVLITPQQLGKLPVGSDADNAQIGFRIGIHVLEILAGACDNENLANDIGSVKAQRNGTDDFVQVQVFPDFLSIQQVADVAAVTLVPAQTVHIRGSFPHFFYKGRGKNIFHMLNLSYSERSVHTP